MDPRTAALARLLGAVQGEDKPAILRALDNDEGINVNSFDEDGISVLEYAAMTNRRCDTAELLLSRGADVNHQDRYDKTPLHRAFFAGNLKVAEFLIAHGADTTIRDKDGKTPLDYKDDPLLSSDDPVLRAEALRRANRQHNQR